MSTAVIAHGATKALQQASEKALDHAAAPKSPEAGSQQAFDQAMQGGNGQPQANGPASATEPRHVQLQNSGGVQAGQGPNTLGDRILGHLDHLRAQQKTTMNEVRSLDDLGELSPESMLRIKMEVDRMAIGEEMTMKGVTVAENDFKQLLKQQG